MIRHVGCGRRPLLTGGRRRRARPAVTDCDRDAARQHANRKPADPSPSAHDSRFPPSKTNDAAITAPHTRNSRPSGRNGGPGGAALAAAPTMDVVGVDVDGVRAIAIEVVVVVGGAVTLIEPVMSGWNVQMYV